jgi:hypothetical protein
MKGQHTLSTDFIPSEFFVAESRRIVEEAEEQGLTLRIIGALAIRHHTMEFSKLHSALSRLGKQEFTDIDFISYGRFANPLERFFTSIGYSPNRGAKLMGVVWASRHMYDAPQGFHVDLFFDKLEMSHILDFRERLEKDSPTIPLPDLLLEKMQIVKINEKDIKDCIVLIRAHDVGSSNREVIDANYIAALLSKDWGLYYTVTTNLAKIKELMPRYDALTDEDRKDVTNKIDTIIKRVEEEPKTRSWKVRAKLGTNKKWYTDVDALTE